MFFLTDNEQRWAITDKNIREIQTNGRLLGRAKYLQIVKSGVSTHNRIFLYSVCKSFDVYTSTLCLESTGKALQKNEHELLERADFIGKSLIFYLEKSGNKPVIGLSIRLLEDLSAQLCLLDIDEIKVQGKSPKRTIRKSSNTGAVSSRKLRTRRSTVSSKKPKKREFPKRSHDVLPPEPEPTYSPDFLELISKTNLKRRGTSFALFAYDTELRREIGRVSALISQHKSSQSNLTLRRLGSPKGLVSAPVQLKVETVPFPVLTSTATSLLSPTRIKRIVPKASCTKNVGFLLSERKKVLMAKYAEIRVPLLSSREQEKYSRCFQPIRTVFYRGKL